LQQTNTNQFFSRESFFGWRIVVITGNRIPERYSAIPCQLYPEDLHTGYVKHSIQSMLTQRVFQIAAEYRQRRQIMTKLTNTAVKPGNGKPSAEEMTVISNVLNPAETKTEEKAPVLQIEPEKLVIPAPEPRKEMTIMEKMLRLENLKFVVEKRAKLVQTRSELDRFQITSNDFNCTMRLNDSDGNVFSTSFTPGVKKVVEFLKGSFDSSIESIEDQIKF
jgi:hypothetical protein